MPKPDDDPSPSAAQRPPGAALRDYACGELDRAIACLGWRGGRLHSGVHQARKSLRRTRAVIALGIARLGPGAELVDREIRRINRRLSALRDAQATIEALNRLLATGADAGSAVALRRMRRKAAALRAASRRKALVDDAGLATPRALLATLRAALASLPWDRVTTEDLGVAVRFSTAHIESAAERVREGGDDVDWHRWRRRVRRLSQQQRALEDAAPALVTGKKHWKALAVSLGEAQDFALLRERCGKRSPFQRDDRRLLRGLAESGEAGMRERIVESAAASTGD